MPEVVEPADPRNLGSLLLFSSAILCDIWSVLQHLVDTGKERLLPDRQHHACHAVRMERISQSAGVLTGNEISECAITCMVIIEVSKSVGTAV